MNLQAHTLITPDLVTPEPSATVAAALAAPDSAPIAARGATTEEMAQQLWETCDRIYAVVSAIPPQSFDPKKLAARTAAVKAWQAATDAATRLSKIAADERKADK